MSTCTTTWFFPSWMGGEWAFLAFVLAGVPTMLVLLLLFGRAVQAEFSWDPEAWLS